ncbi:MAG: hypothetical protein ACK514_14380 [Bacteroidota bacterium]|jgi:hypothetical protein|nr:hypothetical protein [Cytophagales bacterium]
MLVPKVKLNIFAFLLSSCGFAQQEFDIAANSIFYPHKLTTGYFKSEIALSQVKLPFDWLESSVQTPLLHYHAVFGLPKNFSLDGRLSTLVVANQVNLGPRWGKQFDRMSFNLGFDLAYAFGALNFSGFDSSVSTWLNYPNASVGYKINDIVFTVKAELSGVTSTSSRQGTTEVVSDKNFFNGYTIAFYMEQRLWKDHVFILGFKNTYAKYHFMGWPAFSTFNRFYNMPEVYFGLIL